MPTFVRAASVLMWLAWAGGVVTGVTAWLLARKMGSPGLAVLGSIYLLIPIVLALLIYAVMKGRNWARITYSIFAVVAIAVVALNVLAGGSTGIGSRLIGGAVVMVYATILVLLFHSTSNPWFRKRSVM